VLYPAGTLDAFQAKYGAASGAPLKAGASSVPTFSQRVFCHIALIEALKFIATFPRTLDITVIAHGLTQASLDFFTVAASRAWSQHFYENGVSDYRAPAFVGTETLGKAEDQQPIKQDHAAGEVGGGILSANGGGKDSFLALKLMEECNIPVHVFQHARSEYGRFDYQHMVQKYFHPHIDALKSGRARVHEINIMDDFTEGTLMGLLNPDLKGDATKGYPCQVGWPEMVSQRSAVVCLSLPPSISLACHDVALLGVRSCSFHADQQLLRFLPRQ
jgi:hypothetical protein